jgi:hypothetical protein
MYRYILINHPNMIISIGFVHKGRKVVESAVLARTEINIPERRMDPVYREYDDPLPWLHLHLLESLVHVLGCP